VLAVDHADVESAKALPRPQPRVPRPGRWTVRGSRREDCRFRPAGSPSPRWRRPTPRQPTSPCRRHRKQRPPRPRTRPPHGLGPGRDRRGSSRTTVVPATRPVRGLHPPLRAASQRPRSSPG
jgi:hypothetical protein